MYWGYPDANALTLAAGASQDLAIDYGLGNCTGGAGNPFNVLICSPIGLTGNVSGNTYTFTPTPYNIDAFFSNASGQSVDGGVAQILLTPDLEVVTGEQDTKTITQAFGPTAVAAGGSAQVNFRITSNGRTVGSRRFAVQVSAAGNIYSFLRSFSVTGIANALYGKATDDRGTAIAGAAITVFLGDSIVGTATTQSDGRYVVDGLAPGKYRVRLSAAGQPDVYFDGSVSATAVDAAGSHPSVFSAGSQLDSFAYPNPVSQGAVKISFFANSASSAEVEIYDAAGRSIRTLSVNVPGQGWHDVDWLIDDVANGTYFYRVEMGGDETHGKIAVLKRRAR